MAPRRPSPGAQRRHLPRARRATTTTPTSCSRRRSSSTTTRVAPESQGDLFDATEIDEILALRVLTLTDEEKAEARGTDPRAAAIVDRCDDMPPEVWARLHGAIRFVAPSSRPVADADAGGAVTPSAAVVGSGGSTARSTRGPTPCWIGGVEVGKGTQVRLRPSRRADAHDMFLAGLAATVAGVFHDVDGERARRRHARRRPRHRGMLAWQGRYLYFHPDEIEVLPMPVQR